MKNHHFLTFLCLLTTAILRPQASVPCSHCNMYMRDIRIADPRSGDTMAAEASNVFPSGEIPDPMGGNFSPYRSGAATCALTGKPGSPYFQQNKGIFMKESLFIATAVRYALF